MRIVVLNWNPGIVGGAEQYLKAVLPALVEAGHEVQLIHGYAFADHQPGIAPAGVEPWCLAELGMVELLRQVEAWRPELIWIHISESAQLERALAERYPTLRFAHTYDLTCPTGMKVHKWPDPRPCERRAGPGCLIEYYPHRCGGMNPLTMIQAYRRQQDRFAATEQVRGFAVASDYMRSELSRHGIAPDKISKLPLFTPEMQPDGKAPAARPERGELLFLGRLVFVKGAEHAIHAARLAAKQLNRPLRLTIAGEGSEKARLVELAKSREVEITFPGWLGREERLALMRRSDLLLFPSLWPEPFGLVGIEAGCVGLPAVGYATGGITEWLRPACSGELAEGDPPSIEAFADAICRALQNPDHHQALRLGAWRTAHEFTLERHLQALEPLFQRCVVELQ